MALVHPGRPRALSYERGTKASRPLHPAVGLLAGFALLVAVALGVHMLFHMLV